MKRVGLILFGILGLASAAAGGNIEGTIAGWPVNPPSLSRPGAVWLEGVQKPALGENDPVMAQRDGQFIPPFLVVVAGQTVVMPNEDNVAHNVYSVSAPKRFDLGYYAKGEFKAVTFDQPGMVDLQCVIHNFMHARILVVPNPYYSIVAADGSFHIHNVPAGKYVFTLWGEGMAPFSREVNVPASGKLTVHLPEPQK